MWALYGLLVNHREKKKKNSLFPQWSMYFDSAQLKRGMSVNTLLGPVVWNITAA